MHDPTHEEMREFLEGTYGGMQQRVTSAAKRGGRRPVWALNMRSYTMRVLLVRLEDWFSVQSIAPLNSRWGRFCTTLQYRIVRPILGW